MLYWNTHKKWETAQRLIGRSDLFSPKSMAQWKFFSFNLASDTLQEYLRAFYCCRRYKFAIKSVLYNTHWHAAQQHTQIVFFFFFSILTFWRRNYFLILAHPVYKMWIIQ